MKKIMCRRSGSARRKDIRHNMKVNNLPAPILVAVATNRYGVAEICQLDLGGKALIFESSCDIAELALVGDPEAYFNRYCFVGGMHVRKSEQVEQPKIQAIQIA